MAVSPTSKTLNVGETVQLTGTKNPSTTSEGTQWTSSNTSVATVSNSGLVTAKSAGTATITFKNSASTKSATCSITVTFGNIVIGASTAFDATNVLLNYNNNGKLAWKKDITTNSYSNAFSCDIKAVVPLKNGDVIVGAGSGGGYDTVIIKYDKNGNIIWKKSLPTYYYDSKNRYYKIVTINITNDNNIIVGANSSYDKAEKVIMKYNSDGNLIWKKNIPAYKSGEYYYVDKVIVTNNNDIIISVDSYSDTQGKAILKYSSDGNLIWNRKIATYTDNGSTYFYRIGTINLSKDNSIIIGANCGTLVEGSTTSNALIKYDSNGNLVWKKSVTTNTSTNGHKCWIEKISIASDNNIIVGAGTGDGNESVIIKYNNSGGLVWKKNISTYTDSGSTYFYRIGTMTILEDNSIIIGANCGTLVEGSTTSNALIKYDSNGNLVWKKSVTTNTSTNGHDCWIKHVYSIGSNNIIVGAGTGSGCETVIIKYNSNGNVLWKTSLPKYTYSNYNEYYRMTELSVY